VMYRRCGSLFPRTFRGAISSWRPFHIAAYASRAPWPACVAVETAYISGARRFAAHRGAHVPAYSRSGVLLFRSQRRWQPKTMMPFRLRDLRVNASVITLSPGMMVISGLAVGCSILPYVLYEGKARGLCLKSICWRFRAKTRVTVVAFLFGLSVLRPLHFWQHAGSAKAPERHLFFAYAAWRCASLYVARHAVWASVRGAAEARRPWRNASSERRGATRARQPPAAADDGETLICACLHRAPQALPPSAYASENMRQRHAVWRRAEAVAELVAEWRMVCSR